MRVLIAIPEAQIFKEFIAQLTQLTNDWLEQQWLMQWESLLITEERTLILISDASLQNPQLWFHYIVVMAYLSNFLLFKAMSSSDSIDTVRTQELTAVFIRFARRQILSTDSRFKLDSPEACNNAL